MQQAPADPVPPPAQAGWRPLCTTCAYPSPHVYTVYSSASNIRLAVCPRCNSFVDPLIESPPLFLALDLVLLKPRVFLHLLFNRGSPPRLAAAAVPAAPDPEPPFGLASGTAEDTGGCPSGGRGTGLGLGSGNGDSERAKAGRAETPDSTSASRPAPSSSPSQPQRSSNPGGPSEAFIGQSSYPPRAASSHLTPSGKSPPGTAGPSTGPHPLAPALVAHRPGQDREARVRATTVQLALATLAAEVAVRIVPALPLAHLPNPRAVVLLTVARVAVELAAQLGSSTLLALLILRVRGWYPWRPSEGQMVEVAEAEVQAGPQELTDPAMAAPPVVAPGKIRDGRQEAFLPLLVPLTLLYTALIPLLLQLALGIWYNGPPPGAAPVRVHHADDPTAGYFSSPLAFLPAPLAALVPHMRLPATLAAGLRESADATAADPVWSGTRILGGMSAGFGLRVLLPTRPWETTAVVIAGWYAAALAGRAFDAAVLLAQQR